MRKTLLFTFILLMAWVVIGNFAQAQKKKAPDVNHGGQPMTVSMTGSAEVPGPGDTDGTGSATITLNHGQGEVCYELSVANIEKATAAHIHKGAIGEAGDVKVPLTAAADGSWKGCAKADKDLIKDIMQNPANYYVNIHTADFPKGAIRGQLGK